MHKLHFLLNALKNDLIDKLESILGISLGSYIFFSLEIPANIINSSCDGIGQLLTREVVHLLFAIIASVIITTITHVVKVEVSEWYKKFKNKP